MHLARGLVSNGTPSKMKPPFLIAFPDVEFFRVQMLLAYLNKTLKPRN